MMYAIGVLGATAQWRWFGIDKPEVMNAAGGGGGLKKTVLAELGRIRHPAALRNVAFNVMRQNPASDRLAIRSIRASRQYGAVDHDDAALLDEILNFLKKVRVNDHTFPEHDIKKAVDHAARYVRRAIANEKYNAVRSQDKKLNRAYAALQEAESR